jgi:hypothetical protein
MSKSIVYLAIVAIAFAALAIKAQDFDPEAISQVSKAIAEQKLMSDGETEEREVYVSSSLRSKVELGTGQGINAVIGLSAFGEDVAFFELERQRKLMRSYDFRIDLSSTQLNELKRSREIEKALDQAERMLYERDRTLRSIEKGLPRVYWTRNSWMTVDPIIAFDPEWAEHLKGPIWRARRPWPGAYNHRFDVIWMDPERLSEPAWAGSDPDGVLVHELRHRANALKSPLSILDRRKEDYSIDAEIAFDQQRANRFRVEDSIARDFRQKGYGVTVYGSSYSPERFAVEDRIARDLRQKGHDVTVYESYGEWRLDRSYQEYKLDPKRYGLGYEIGKLDSGSIIGPYGHRISTGGWNTSLQQYYNKIGAGTSFYTPSYARPRTSYPSIGQRR